MVRPPHRNRLRLRLRRAAHVADGDHQQRRRSPGGGGGGGPGSRSGARPLSPATAPRPPLAAPPPPSSSPPLSLPPAPAPSCKAALQRKSHRESLDFKVWRKSLLWFGKAKKKGYGRARSGCTLRSHTIPPNSTQSSVPSTVQGGKCSLLCCPASRGAPHIITGSRWLPPNARQRPRTWMGEAIDGKRRGARKVQPSQTLCSLSLELQFPATRIS